MLDRGTILVTGGAGFIGSAVVWALNQRGHERILIGDELDRSDKWRNLVPLRFDDVISPDTLREAVERRALDNIGAIIHLGACSSTTEADAAYLLRNNTAYTRMLAEWALSRQVRFVYASSAATYGGLEGTLDERHDLRTLRPLNMYGYSKHLFDLQAASRGYLTQIAGLKYFNVFGPNESHKGDMRSVVNKAFHQIQKTGRVQLFKSHRPDFADGEQRRDFLYVKDAVAMTLHIADRGDANGLFNIGAGASHTWNELVTTVFKAMDRPVNIDFIEMPEALQARYQYSTESSISRLRASGYHTAITPFDEAIDDYVRHYLAHDRRLGDEATRPATVTGVS
jgi:ADP-L-glycero-D-manno-heptose 6-epimerase